MKKAGRGGREVGAEIAGKKKEEVLGGDGRFV